MDKRITCIGVFLLVVVGIHAQGGGGFRRLMFMSGRDLALRRAFPFGVPLTFRGTRFPTRFSSGFPFGRPSTFSFGSRPLTLSGFGTRPFGTPFRTTFPPGFFESSRFGTRSPFEGGFTGDPGFFRGSSGFPTMGGFPEGGFSGDSGFVAGPGFGERIPTTGSEFPSGPVFGGEGVPPTGSGFPTGPVFGGEGVPPTGSGFQPGDTGMRDPAGGSSMTTDTTGAISGDGQGGSTGGQNDLNNDGRGSSMQGSNEIMPGMGPRPDAFPGSGTFPAGTGMTGSFGRFDPRFSREPTFGPGFGRMELFPGDRMGGFPDRRFESRVPEGTSGFDQSDRGAFFPRGQGEMTRDGRFFGPGPFDPSFGRTIAGTTTFPRDPRFESFGPFPAAGGRFVGSGPGFDPRGPTSTGFDPRGATSGGFDSRGTMGGGFDPRGTTSDPNMNFPPMSGSQGQNGGSRVSNQITPTGSGNQAAQIDGFGAVSSTNNLNTNDVNSGTRNTNRPSAIIRFEGDGSRRDVIMNEGAANNAAASSNNEFRVVEVGNILDNSASSGRVTGSSTDQSVVDSMGFQSGGETNMASSRVGTETTVLIEGNRSNSNVDPSLPLSSPLNENQDFSFFVPSENNAGSQQGSAVFNAPAPPPPPPIMVPSNNQPGTNQ